MLQLVIVSAFSINLIIYKIATVTLRSYLIKRRARIHFMLFRDLKIIKANRPP